MHAEFEDIWAGMAEGEISSLPAYPLSQRTRHGEGGGAG
jgi:hypothetical protein